MRFIALVFLSAIAAFASPSVATAQPYCAVYDDDSMEGNCGIPTLESCQQSISGMGGSCVPDQTAQIPDGPPTLFQRLRRRNENILLPSDPAQDQPGGLNWMPPPPGQ